MKRRRRRVFCVAVALAFAQPAAGQTIEIRQWLTPGTYLGGRLALSPDGTTLYHTSVFEMAIFSRDPSTGELAFLTDLVLDGEGVVGGGDDIAVAPDGGHVYFARDDTVYVFERNALDGTLIESSARDLDDGSGPCALALSGDGAFAYAACSGANAVLAFAVDGGDGSLGEPTPVAVPGGPRDLALSPDGAHLYVSSFDLDALRLYARDAGTGALSFVESYVDGENGVAGLDEVEDIAVTPDGSGVYARGHGGVIAAFARDLVSGALSFVEQDGPGTVHPYGDRLAADDDVVWLLAHAPGPRERPLELLAFTRDPASNAIHLADRKVLIDQQTGFGPSGLAVDPHGGVIATGAYVGMFRAVFVPEPDALPAFLAAAAALGAQYKRRDV